MTKPESNQHIQHQCWQDHVLVVKSNHLEIRTLFITEFNLAWLQLQLVDFEDDDGVFFLYVD